DAVSLSGWGQLYTRHPTTCFARGHPPRKRGGISKRLWNKHRRALQPSLAQIGERFVGLRERVTRHLATHAGLRRDLQEFLRVLARQIRDRTNLPFLPKDRIGKARHI